MTANDILIQKYPILRNETNDQNVTIKVVRNTTTPVEDFWEHRVLQINGGLEHGLGGIQWELAGCLLLAFLMVAILQLTNKEKSKLWIEEHFGKFVSVIIGIN